MSINIQNWYLNYLGYHHFYSQYHQSQQSRSTRATGQTTGEISPLSATPATRFLYFLRNPETLTLHNLGLHALKDNTTRVVEFKVKNSASSWPVRFYPESKQYEFQTPENSENFEKAIFSEVSKSEEQQINTHLQKLLPFEIVDLILDEKTLNLLKKANMERNENGEYIIKTKNSECTISLLLVKINGKTKLLLRINTKQDKIYDFNMDLEQYMLLFSTKVSEYSEKREQKSQSNNSGDSDFLSDLESNKKKVPKEMYFYTTKKSTQMILEYTIPHKGPSYNWTVRMYVQNGNYSFQKSNTTEKTKWFGANNGTKRQNQIKKHLEELIPPKMVRWITDGERKRAEEALKKGKFIEGSGVDGEKIDGYNVFLFEDTRIRFQGERQFEFNFGRVWHDKLFEMYPLLYKEKVREHLLRTQNSDAPDKIVSLLALKETYDALEKSKFTKRTIEGKEQKILLGTKKKGYTPFLYREGRDDFIIGVYTQNNAQVIKINFTEKKIEEYANLIKKKEHDVLDWVELWEPHGEENAQEFTKALQLMKTPRKGITLICPAGNSIKKFKKEWETFMANVEKINENEWGSIAILENLGYSFEIEGEEKKKQLKISKSIDEVQFSASLEMKDSYVILLYPYANKIRLKQTGSQDAGREKKFPILTQYNKILQEKYVYDWESGEKNFYNLSNSLTDYSKKRLDKLALWNLRLGIGTTENDLKKALSLMKQKKSGITMILPEWLPDISYEEDRNLIVEFKNCFNQVNQHTWACLAIITTDWPYKFTINEERNVLSIDNENDEWETLNLPTDYVVILDGDNEKITLLKSPSNQTSTNTKRPNAASGPDPSVASPSVEEIQKGKFIYDWDKGQKDFERLLTSYDLR